MIKKNIVEALNKQIQHEQSNAHSYLAVALYFEALNLHGLAAWLFKQVSDERGHAEKFTKHLLERGGSVELGAIASPKARFANPLEAIQQVQALERVTTALIHKLTDLARKENDYALEVLMHWFITEQVEEEQWAAELLAQMEQFHKNPGHLYMLDHQWGKRAKSE
jgi:ferritin